MNWEAACKATIVFISIIILIALAIIFPLVAIACCVIGILVTLIIAWMAIYMSIKSNLEEKQRKLKEEKKEKEEDEAFLKELESK